MNYLQANYLKILEVIKSTCHHIIDQNGNYYPRKGPTKMSDIEIVALSLTAEKESIDSENLLFQKITPALIPNLIERSQFNKRRRKLFQFTEIVRTKIAQHFVELEDVFIIDSMPLEVCKLARANRCKICRGDFETAPQKGYCASQKLHFFGYKLHATCTVNGVFSSFELTKANVHDIHYLQDVQDQLADCLLIGDKGYLSAQQQLNLFETSQIKLKTPMRRNQHNYQKFPYIFSKSRKRIETLFSQLCDQFMIRRNYAKSFSGFKTRILAKITSLTIIQYINKFLFDRNINNIKVQII